MDEVPLFKGRTAVELYRDLCASFVETFKHRRAHTPCVRVAGCFCRARGLSEERAGCAASPHRMGNTIQYVAIGLGPAGELRYPSYPEVRTASVAAAQLLACLIKYPISPQNIRLYVR